MPELKEEVGVMTTAQEGVFTVQELAKYLRMKPLTIYKHASAGKLPGFKVGSHWRFKKKTIDRWIEDQESNGDHKKSIVS